MKPEELDKAIRTGDIGPLYYLYGEEQYLVERGTQRLLQLVVDPGFRDFNYNLFYGKECRGEEIVEAAQTLPMFAERRAILVKRSSDLPAAALEVLLGYVQNPSPTTCLIFQGEKIDQRKKFFAELKRGNALVEYKRPYENQLGGFIREELAADGKRIEPAAAELLVHLIGNNLSELAAQLEKLITYVGERPAISLDDVRAIVSDTKVDSVFELANALGGRDLAGALRRLQTVIRDGDAPYLVIGALARHFRQLWLVRELLEKRVATDEIGKRTGINPFFLKGMITQAKRFDGNELRGIFRRLHETDVAMKSSGGKPQLLLELLVMDICGVAAKG